MTLTRHGHHIPGTPDHDENRFVSKARCGGLGLCFVCSKDNVQAQVKMEREKKEKSVSLHVDRFRSQPVDISAIRMPLEDPNRTKKDLEEDIRTIARWIDSNGGEVSYMDAGELTIKTLEGEMTAQLGDWIIQGTEGEFYPCKPSVFDRKYRRLDGHDATYLVN